MGILNSEQAKSLILEWMTIMLQNVNSEIYRFWLITPFADCAICKPVECCRAAKRWRTTDVAPGATYVGLPYTIQTFFRERGKSVSFPPQQTAHRKRFPCPLWDSWVLNVDSHRTNEGSFSETLSLIFDNARRTAHRTYLCTIATLGPYLTTVTLHSSQRFGARRKKTDNTKSSKLHHFILGSLLNTTFGNKPDKLGASCILAPWYRIWHLQSTYPLFSCRLLFIYYSLCVCIFLHSFKQLRVFTNEGNTLLCQSGPVMLHK
jgi:hypothetical protein